jgi:hypothetical protein
MTSDFSVTWQFLSKGTMDPATRLFCRGQFRG